jgi:hypothetical protein
VDPVKLVSLKKWEKIINIPFKTENLDDIRLVLDE